MNYYIIRTYGQNMRKLQSTCRIISGAKKYDHISPLLKELNWLLEEKLIYLRGATLAFKCMTGSAADYLTSKFIPSWRLDFIAHTRSLRACLHGGGDPGR